MVVEEKIQALLVGAAGVTALVPAARIKMPGDWQDLPRPYIVHGPVSIHPTYTHEGLIDLRDWEFYQVSCFADKVYSDAKRIAVAVRAALGSYVGADGTQIFWRNEVRQPFEADLRIQQIVVEFEVWEVL